MRTIILTIHGLLYFVLPIVMAVATFIIAHIISFSRIRMRMNRHPNTKKGLLIFFTSLGYLFMHIVLFATAILIQANLFCNAAGTPTGDSACGWYMFIPIIGSLLLFPVGLIVYIIRANTFIKKIQARTDTTQKVRWSAKERKLFFVLLALYIYVLSFLLDHSWLGTGIDRIY